MQLCMSCGRIFDDDDGLFLTNENFDDETTECFPCHVEAMNNGWVTQCENCHEYFSGNHLKLNHETGVEELCPYCGEVWCE